MYLVTVCACHIEIKKGYLLIWGVCCEMWRGHFDVSIMLVAGCSVQWIRPVQMSQLRALFPANVRLWRGGRLSGWLWRTRLPWVKISLYLQHHSVINLHEIRRHPTPLELVEPIQLVLSFVQCVKCPYSLSFALSLTREREIICHKIQKNIQNHSKYNNSGRLPDR